jgi:hypothetical protein
MLSAKKSCKFRALPPHGF